MSHADGPLTLTHAMLPLVVQEDPLQETLDAMLPPEARAGGRRRQRGVEPRARAAGIALMYGSAEAKTEHHGGGAG